MTLKPCPFCCETEHLEQMSDCGDRYIECLECGARGPVADSEAEAAEFWNRGGGALIA